jgi:hypothetical protein
MFLTQRRLPRRAVLKGIGATVALPFLDAMVPAGAFAGRRGVSDTDSPQKTRLVCIEIVHGAAGSTQFGVQKNLWAPATTGRDFDLAGTSLSSLEPFRNVLTIVSNTDVASANATEAREIGGDHFRSTAVFLTQSYPKRTEGADVEAGTSLDQIYAQRIGQETPIPSMQMCIEGVDQSGGCQYGYSCAYVDSLSWASPTRPLPMVRDPRVIFDELHGVFGVGTTEAERMERRRENASILDWVAKAAARLKRTVGPADRVRIDDYLDNVRQIERRIQNVEARNRTGEIREFPAAPAGIPDSFAEHVQLMFDLQLLAFRTDYTRVFTLKLSRDGSNRAYPESGYNGPFHNTSHHSNREERILDLARINAYHVSMLRYFLEKLKSIPDDDGTLLDSTLVVYGSPMGDPNLHNHKRVPFFIVAPSSSTLPGGRHVRAPTGTPLASAMLSVLHALGLEDLAVFGDSEGALSLS